eukprot:COSAG01_NODE_21511_length_898_cov_24.344180_1_plen_104_part_10
MWLRVISLISHSFSAAACWLLLWSRLGHTSRAAGIAPHRSATQHRVAAALQLARPAVQLDRQSWRRVWPVEAQGSISDAPHAAQRSISLCQPHARSSALVLLAA